MICDRFRVMFCFFQVVRLLQASRLCFLSTFSDDHPHLSLMNFTYYPGERNKHVVSCRRCRTWSS